MTWPEPSPDDERDARAGPHRKTRPLLARAAGRPFARVEDEITDRDRLWVSAHHDRPALPLRVDPRRGLPEADFAVLEGWFARL
ncbi:hypothetical protein [Streptomyces sp. NPDC020141]|uniref:hypothetical protein n=1 Tax=Streptomyces sp. NPDC020141 TaxID=3365065 RepID=UPI0037B0B268